MLTVETGPFELTKLSAQISVLMADRNDGGGKNEAIRKSYQNLGTWRTAQNLIKHRGWRGLYSGFHLHLCRFTDLFGLCTANMSSTRFHRDRHLFCNLREHETGSSKHARYFAYTSSGCGCSRWALWTGQLGMCKC